MASKNSSFLIFLGIVIAGLIIGGAIVYSNNTSNNQLSSDGGQEDSAGNVPQEVTVTQDDHIRGDVNAPVTIVEFSDFQCPYCGRFAPTVKQIVNDYSAQVRLVYRHFPLDQIHPNARPAAEASECAAEQGKFWEFADGLFEKQSSLGASFYKQLASQLGLDMEQFNDCLSSRKYKDRVESDYQEGIKLGVRGTPASFVNGELVSGAVSYDTLKAKVEQFLSNP